jgi:(p)ppGpp synthase/HD superfamily hydrolase
MLSPLIERAVELSAQWHDGTYRKFRWRDEPFEKPDGDDIPVPVSSHTTMVGLLVAQAGWDEATVAAAFLHDVLEDRNIAGLHMRRKELADLMGEEVTLLVETVTEQKRSSWGVPRSWEDRKQDYVERLRCGSPEAVAISLADKLHNLWTMNQTIAGGINPFRKGGARTPLSRGPQAQQQFFEAVLEASEQFEDPRLDGMREAVREQLLIFREISEG